MPKKMKSKQEVWTPISIFDVAGSVIPNVFSHPVGAAETAMQRPGFA